MSLTTFYTFLVSAVLVFAAVWLCVLTVGLARIVRSLLGKPTPGNDPSRW